MKKILGVLILALVVFAAIVAMQPNEFRITRSATLLALPETIFAQVNTLQNWEAWSPWARLDPNAKVSYEGPSEGVGAIMRWNGNMDVGAGSMTITESTPASLVRFQLDFLKPMENTSTAEFSFTPQSDGTLVTWSMHGTNNFLGKAMGLIFDCEKMVGEQFEKGLTNLKSVVEVQAETAS